MRFLVGAELDMNTGTGMTSPLRTVDIEYALNHAFPNSISSGRLTVKVYDVTDKTRETSAVGLTLADVGKRAWVTSRDGNMKMQGVIGTTGRGDRFSWVLYTKNHGIQSIFQADTISLTESVDLATVGS